MSSSNSKEKALWIEECLYELAEKTKIDGQIWRAIYTNEDKVGKELLANKMKEARLKVYEDSVGNLFGSLRGKSDKTILIGSHLDTVKDGGIYDGALGIVSAIAVLGELARNGKEFEKTIEVVAFGGEEGSRFNTAYIGSKAIVGRLSSEDLVVKDINDISLKEAMKSSGYNQSSLSKAKRKDLSSFIELHVEQGPLLEQNKKQIGIVESIVGIVTYSIIIKGFQNHAGTTPMSLRTDPVEAASLLITKTTEEVRKLSSKATITFGRVEAFPGMVNVIADKVVMSVDYRAGDKVVLSRIDSILKNNLNELIEKGYEVDMKNYFYTKPTMLNKELIYKLHKSVNNEKADYMYIDSGAGHDAQILADYIPTCMIFVPSKKGISHSPEEFTSLKDIEMGYKVLLNFVKSIVEGY